ncbi:hypothetical protein N1851_020454 [Merluccius polli]|uniref:C-type lectin domain-containing protein n=1 Tax=Merluccius polli TaxID=89951 RepID=A0AA47MKS4_MERPO|nr:hypothetical protein N1851_020454 [Merluccius polli]
MLERTYDNPKAREWIQRRDNWMSDTIQNEILEILAHAVQRHIVSDARRSSFFGLTADGTTDLALITFSDQLSTPGQKEVPARLPPGEPTCDKSCVYLDVDGTWMTAFCNMTKNSACMQSAGTVRR